LDTDFSSLPEWISMKAMVSTWLADAIMYELWVGSDGASARTMYYSGLPWLIGKAPFMSIWSFVNHIRGSNISF